LAQVGPPEEAPEELVRLAVRGSPWGQATRREPTQEGPGKVENPTSVGTTIGTDA